MNDEIFMSRCLQLASKALGLCYPNPMVGAVIVHDGKIIGEGYHHKAGKPHSEINAISKVEQLDLLKDSTLYVSLEPCSHYGRTPPCALKLKELGFKRVVIATLDSNEKVRGNGLKILQEAGIETTVGVLEKEARKLNERFFTFHESKRPFITLKWAQTKRGYLDNHFEPYAISNDLVNQWVHQLRSQEQSILVGTTTALRDNPSLSVRHLEGKPPTRVVIDMDLKIPANYNLFDHSQPTIIINSLKEEVSGMNHFVKVDRTKLIPNLLEKLHQLQIQSIIIEGGSQTLQQFIELGLWDRIIRIQNPDTSIESGTKAPDLAFQSNTQFKLRDNQVELFLNK